MKKITFLVISLMSSASAYGQGTTSTTTPTTNSIYIDQVGDGSTIELTQEGDSNAIGEGESPTDRFVLEGNGQAVTVKQQGDSNVIRGSVVDAANIDYVTTVTGDENTIEYNQGDAGSVAGSAKVLTVAGSNNTLTFNQGTDVDPESLTRPAYSDTVSTQSRSFPAVTINPGTLASTGASATGADQTIRIIGSDNKYTSTINTDDVKNDVDVAGSNNVIKMVQDGTAGKNIEMLLTGSANAIIVNQKSTNNVDTVIIDSTSTGSTLVINQCNTGGPC